MGEPDPQPRSALPAPYESPWLGLGRSLQAVVASVGLQARELWRRNRAGDLPLPPFWPQPLAPLYWPSLALVGLMLAAGLLLGVPMLVGRVPPSVDTPAPLTLPEAVSPPRDPSAPTAPEPSAAPQPVPQPAVLPAQPSSPPPAPPEQALAAEAERPLLAELALADRLGILAAARTEPGAGQLVLVVTAGWFALEPAERQRQADTWHERAEALGYERLDLEDGQGHLLARAARVGSGMILLAPPLPADARGS